MAIRLLAKGLFGITTEKLRSQLKGNEEKLLGVGKVMEVIVNEIRLQTKYQGDIFLFIHIDEFQMAVDQSNERFVKVFP